MASVISKIKNWIRVGISFLVAVFVITFVAMNLTAVVEPKLVVIPFVWSVERANVLIVLLLTSVLSIFGWWLFRMTFRTLRQLRESQLKSRTARLEKEMLDMKTKAGMLQTRENGAPVPAPAPPAGPQPGGEG